MAVKRKVVGMEDWEVELLHTPQGFDETGKRRGKRRRVDVETKSANRGATPRKKEDNVVFNRCDKVYDTEKSMKVEAKDISKNGAATYLVDAGKASKDFSGEDGLEEESSRYEEERNRILEENRKRMHEMGLRNLTNQLSPNYRTLRHLKSAAAANQKRRFIKQQVEIGFQSPRSMRMPPSDQEVEVDILKDGPATDLLDVGDVSKIFSGEDDLEEEIRRYEEERNRILEGNRIRMQESGLRNLTNQLSPSYRIRAHLKSATAANKQRNFIKHQIHVGLQPLRSTRILASGLEAEVDILKDGLATDLFDEGEASKGERLTREEDPEEARLTYEEGKTKILQENKKRMQDLGLLHLTKQLSHTHKTRSPLKRNYIKQVVVGFQPRRSPRIAGSDKKAEVDILKAGPATDLFDESEASIGLSGEEDLEEERRIYEDEKNKILEENRKRMQELGLLDLTKQFSRTPLKRNWVKHQVEIGFQPRRSARVASRAERSKVPTKNTEGQSEGKKEKSQGRAERAERRAEEKLAKLQISEKDARKNSQLCNFGRIYQIIR